MNVEQLAVQASFDAAQALAQLEAFRRRLDATAASGQAGMNGIGRAAGEASGATANFARQGIGQVAGLVPGLDRVTGMFAGLPAVINPVTAAIAGVVGVLVVGAKAAGDMADKFKEQKEIGSKIGVSGIAMENIERKTIAASGGTMSRADVQNQVKEFGTKFSTANLDRSGIGTEARVMKQMGVSRGSVKGGNAEKALAEFQKKAQSVSEEAARGMAEAAGLSADFGSAMHKMSDSVVKFTAMTNQEVITRKQAELQSAKLTAATNELKEKFGVLWVQIGSALIPAVNAFMTAVNALFDAIGKGIDYVKKPLSITLVAIDDFVKGVIALARKIPMVGDSVAESLTVSPIAWVADAGGEMGRNYLDSQTEEGKKKTAEEAEAFLKKQSENAKVQYKAGQDFKKAVQDFQGATMQFSTAISQEQAMAAWAGEVGKAGGMKSVVAGQSREELQKVMLASNTGKLLGVDTAQIQQGKVSQADLDFAIRNMHTMLRNEVMASKRNIATLPQNANLAQRREAAIKLKDAERGLQVFERQQKEGLKGREGGREITAGAMDARNSINMNLNFHGNADPAKVKEAASQGVVQGLGAAVNQRQSARGN